MWLFCPVMNSSTRNDRMAILRNSFNSASLRANVIFFLVAFKRTDDVLNGRQLLLIITYFFIGTPVWLIAMFQTLLLALRTVHHLCEDKHLPSSPIYCRYQSQHICLPLRTIGRVHTSVGLSVSCVKTIIHHSLL